MKCSDKEWQHCQKEKRGCEGCFYNDEISIGEYVRTPKQGIFIISHINKPFKDDDKNKVCLCQNSKVAFVSINTIKQLKHSKDIIDLIEEGDVIEINNKKYEVIFDKSYEKLGLLIPNREHLAIRHCSLEYIFSNEGMKEFESISIVTKEQIKQIEYVIKEEVMEPYIELFEEDIKNLIDSIKNIEMNTKEGEDVKFEILSKLYSETF